MKPQINHKTQSGTQAAQNLASWSGKLLAGISIATGMLVLGSCKDVLDLKPLNAYSESDVWDRPQPGPGICERHLRPDSAGLQRRRLRRGAQTDELYGNFNWTNENSYVQGEATADNQTSSSLNRWGDLYGSIRKCNVFLKTRASWTPSLMDRPCVPCGEVHFLRALAYFEMLKRFGGVPLITKVYDVNDKAFDEKRASWTETQNFILADIAEATRLLPAAYAADIDKGRATIGAALALKSRLMLYAASPYFHTSGDKKLWQQAKEAAKAVIDFKGAPYALYGSAGNGTYNKTYLDFFNPEVIFARVYSGLARADPV